MMRVRAVLLFAAFGLAATACGDEPASPTPEPASHAPASEVSEGEASMTDQIEGLCRITRGKHVEAPAQGNRSTSSSNGMTLTVLGSRSQSVSSVNGKAVVTVTGAAMLHLTFPDGELVSVETSTEADLIEITIDGPDAISCETVA